MKKGIITIIILIFIKLICFGQSNVIWGIYNLNHDHHLYNPTCTKSKLILRKDSIYTFFDCDWLRQDTLKGKYNVVDNCIILLNYKKNKDIKLFYKKDRLYYSKFRRFFNLIDYKKKTFTSRDL